MFGNPCDIETIDKIAKVNDLKIIYDAAHAFGCSYEGKSISNIGKASVISMHATKVIRQSHACNITKQIHACI